MTQPVVIAVGSNLGDSRGAVLEAIALLRSRAAGDWRSSPLYKTAPVDCPPGSACFINAVVSFTPRADDSPLALLEWMLDVERGKGRLPKRMTNEARVLDLDLIAYGDRVMRTSKLTLPHPRARLRRFVLEPLAEIMPWFVFPGDAATVVQLLHNLSGTGTVERLTDS